MTTLMTDVRTVLIAKHTMTMVPWLKDYFPKTVFQMRKGAVINFTVCLEVGTLRTAGIPSAEYLANNKGGCGKSFFVHRLKKTCKSVKERKRVRIDFTKRGFKFVLASYTQT